jgi:S-layer protein
MATSNILKLVAGMFNGAPGGAILGDLKQAVDAGMSLPELADILENTNQFQSLVGGLDTAGKVEFLMNNFGLTADGVEGSAATRAENFFTNSIEDGVGLGFMVYQAVVFLESDNLPEEFADVAALLNNKALVAEVHAANYQTIANVAAGQALFVGVTSTFPMTQEEALQHVEDIVGEPGNGEPGPTFSLTADAVAVEVVNAQVDAVAKAILADFNLDTTGDLPAVVTATFEVTNGLLATGGNAQLTADGPTKLTFQGSPTQLQDAIKAFTYQSAASSAATDNVTITVKSVGGTVLGTISEEISVGRAFAYDAAVWDGKTVTGTAQSDLFSGAQADVIKATALDGGAGYDVLQVSAVTGAGTLTNGISTTGIERVELTLTGVATVDASKFAGVEVIESKGAHVGTYQKLTTDTRLIQTGDANVSLALAEAQAADTTFTVIMNGMSGKAIIDAEAATSKAIKDLTINANAASGTTTITAGSNLQNITVLGVAAVNLNTLTSLDDFTLDASALENNLTLNLAGTGDVNLIGGKGVNSFVFGATLDENDVVMGGDLNEAETNQDTLTATVTGDDNAFNISKVEEITFTMGADADVTIDAANITGADSIAIVQAGTGNTFTLENLESSTVVQLTALAATNTVAVEGASGDGSSASFSVTDATAGILRTTGIETVNIETSGGAVTLAAVSTTGANTLVVTGDQDLTITAPLATAINTVNLSEFEGTFTATVRGGSTVQVGEDAELALTLATGINAGADIIAFVYGGEEGKADFEDQAIVGFQVSQDKLDLSAFGITLDDLSLAGGAHAEITVDTGEESFTITLTGVDQGDLVLDNFIF